MSSRKVLRPLSFPKMTSSVRLPVSIRAVGKMVSDLPIGPADQ
jgi:hypothetical protein